MVSEQPAVVRLFMDRYCEFESIPLHHQVQGFFSDHRQPERTLATVLQWHRQDFRLYRRWRSRSGRRPIADETRKLIRQMCLANPGNILGECCMCRIKFLLRLIAVEPVRMA